MSIAAKIKQEILDAKIPSSCCKKAFLSGVIRGAGSLSVEQNGLGLLIQHPSRELIDKSASLIYSLTKISPMIMQKDKDRTLGSKLVYELYLGGNHSKKLLMDSGITSAPSQITQGIPSFLIAKDCCKKSYLKGLFLASGVMSLGDDLYDSNSKSKGYFLELAVSSREVAKDIKNMLAEKGIEAKVRARKNTFLVYLKDSDKIADFCILLDATKGYFAIQDIIVSRSIRNTANRQTNCEIANIDRVLDASAKQMEAIRLIDKHMGLDNLTPQLKETAKIRLANPGASIGELLTLMENPPSKSGLNHRMRKLIEISKDFEEKE